MYAVRVCLFAASSRWCRRTRPKTTILATRKHAPPTTATRVGVCLFRVRPSATIIYIYQRGLYYFVSGRRRPLSLAASLYYFPQDTLSPPVRNALLLLLLFRAPSRKTMAQVHNRGGRAPLIPGRAVKLFPPSGRRAPCQIGGHRKFGIGRRGNYRGCYTAVATASLNSRRRRRKYSRGRPIMANNNIVIIPSPIIVYRPVAIIIQPAATCSYYYHCPRTL